MPEGDILCPHRDRLAVREAQGSGPERLQGQLQRDVEYTAGMFADITSGINVDRNQNRFDKKQAENSERLTVAKAFNQEEPEQYFQQMKKYTKLFGY